MKIIKLNNRGQAFTVFKMLIGLAFAMALLGLIYEATSNISCPSPAFKEVETIVLQASRAPNKCFERTICFDKNALLEKGYYSKAIGVNVDFNLPSSFSLASCGSGSCSFSKKISVPVKVTCSPPSSSSSSPSCRVDLAQTCSSP